MTIERIRRIVETAITRQDAERAYRRVHLDFCQGRAELSELREAADYLNSIE